MTFKVVSVSADVVWRGVRVLTSQTGLLAGAPADETVGLIFSFVVIKSRLFSTRDFLCFGLTDGVEDGSSRALQGPERGHNLHGDSFLVESVRNGQPIFPNYFQIGLK